MSLLRGCKTKKRYGSEIFAAKLADKLSTQRGVKLRAYFCGACKGWHLTKRPTLAEELDAKIIEKQGQVFTVAVGRGKTIPTAELKWTKLGTIRRRRKTVEEFTTNTGFISDVLNMARVAGMKRSFKWVRVGLAEQAGVKIVVVWSGPPPVEEVVEKTEETVKVSFRVKREDGSGVRWAKSGSLPLNGHLTLDQYAAAPTFTAEMIALAKSKAIEADMVLLVLGSERRIIGLGT